METQMLPYKSQLKPGYIADASDLMHSEQSLHRRFWLELQIRHRNDVMFFISNGYCPRWHSGGMCLCTCKWRPLVLLPLKYVKSAFLGICGTTKKKSLLGEKYKHLVSQNYTINKHMRLSILIFWLLVFRSILKRKYGQHSQWFDTEGSASRI